MRAHLSLGWVKEHQHVLNSLLRIPAAGCYAHHEPPWVNVMGSGQAWRVLASGSAGRAGMGTEPAACHRHSAPPALTGACIVQAYTMRCSSPELGDTSNVSMSSIVRTLCAPFTLPDHTQHGLLQSSAASSATSMACVAEIPCATCPLTSPSNLKTSTTQRSAPELGGLHGVHRHVLHLDDPLACP